MSHNTGPRSKTRPRGEVGSLDLDLRQLTFQEAGDANNRAIVIRLHLRSYRVNAVGVWAVHTVIPSNALSRMF